jgi:hypothetical protein
MKYLCLIYNDERRVETMPQDELDAVMRDCEPFVETLRAKGKLIAADRLQPTGMATTIRIGNGGKASITDGPFAETKEQLGGYYLIDARDLDEAISIASRIPPARFGCVEVRPIRA